MSRGGFTILTGLLVGVASLWAPRAAEAQVHLSGPAELGTLCRYAPTSPEGPASAVKARPIASSGAVPEPGSGGGSFDASSAAWAEARSGRLLQVYSVDIGAASFQIAGFDARRGALTLIGRQTFEVFGGAWGIDLGVEPLLVFDADTSTFEEVQAAHAAGALNLRLYVVLSALQRPEEVFCRPTPDGTQVQVAARLLATRLWRGGDGQLGPEGAGWLLEQRLPEAARIASVYGLDALGAAGPRPQVSVRLAGPELAAARGAAMAHDLERLLLPCYLAALGEGGPQTAALTLEATFEGTKATGGFVNVDATGFPPLGECVVERVRQLVGAGGSGAWRARFTAYFERR